MQMFFIHSYQQREPDTSVWSKSRYWSSARWVRGGYMHIYIYIFVHACTRTHVHTNMHNRAAPSSPAWTGLAALASSRWVGCTRTTPTRVAPSPPHTHTPCGLITLPMYPATVVTRTQTAPPFHRSFRLPCTSLPFWRLCSTATIAMSFTET